MTESGKQQKIPDIFKNKKIQILFEDRPNQQPDKKSAPAPIERESRDTAIVSWNSAYLYHGHVIPDPYRPLENTPSHYLSEEEKRKHPVQQWIDTQTKRWECFPGRNRTEEIKKHLAENWIESPDIPDPYRQGIISRPTPGQEGQGQKINDSSYAIALKDNIASLIKQDENSEAQIIIFSEDAITSPSFLLKEVHISPDENLIFCSFNREETQDISGSQRQYFLLNKEGKIIKKFEKDLLFFEAWDIEGRGFYYQFTSGEGWGLFYHSLSPSRTGDILLIQKYSPHPENTNLSFGQICCTPQENHITIRQNLDGKYDYRTRTFVINPAHPDQLLELPEIETGAMRQTPYVIGFNGSRILATIVRPFSIMDIIEIDSTCGNAVKTLIAGISVHEIEDIVVCNEQILTIQMEDLQSVLHIYDMYGHLIFSFKPDIRSSLKFAGINHKTGNAELTLSHYLLPWEKYEFNHQSRRMMLKDRHSLPEWIDQLTVSQATVKSGDGTEIPLTLVHRKDMAKNSDNPTILYGYGGFGICITPNYASDMAWWVKQGGVYAIAHVRGEGGWQAGWAEQGARRQKQNTFSDFTAAAEHLIQTGITSSKRMICMGASNGGMLAAVAIQQRPDLYAGAVSQMPVYDMMNHQLAFSGNGKMAKHGRTGWLEDYGLPEIKEDFEILRAYSPLHNIKGDIEYPPILVMCGGQDFTAHPGHALKFVATMQDLAGIDSAWLYYKPGAGHSSLFSTEEGKTDFQAYADMYSFILHAVNQENSRKRN